MRRLQALAAHVRTLTGHQRLTVILALFGAGATSIWRLRGVAEPGFVDGLLMVAIPLATAATSAIPLIASNLKQADSRTDAATVQDILRLAVHSLSTCPESTGALLYLPRDDELLAPRLTHNKEGKPDIAISFSTRSGCTGHTWWTERQSIADLTKTTAAELRDTWKLDPAQIKITEHLQAVLCTPIRAPDGKKIGVLTIDCEEDGEVSGLFSDESQKLAELHAALLGRTLVSSNLLYTG